MLYWLLLRVETALAPIVTYRPGHRLGWLGLSPTYPHFGEVRWWLSCPSCGGRSGKLYLPTPHGEFACRLCHDLTYESCLRSKDSDAFLRKIASEAGLSLRLVKELLG